MRLKATMEKHAVWLRSLHERWIRGLQDFHVKCSSLQVHGVFWSGWRTELKQRTEWLQDASYLKIICCWTCVLRRTRCEESCRLKQTIFCILDVWCRRRLLLKCPWARHKTSWEVENEKERERGRWWKEMGREKKKKLEKEPERCSLLRFV